MSDTDRPKPGSDEAIAAGCRCPVLDNARGRGYMGIANVFVMSGDCPMHAFESRPDDGDHAAIFRNATEPAGEVDP